ncbi:hypothetical protein B7463_g370, partial [Scytalidium lignicola]
MHHPSERRVTTGALASMRLIVVWSTVAGATEDISSLVNMASSRSLKMLVTNLVFSLSSLREVVYIPSFLSREPLDCAEGMAGFKDLNPLKVAKRASRTQYSGLPTHEIPRRRDIDEEKYESEYSEDDDDYSSYPSSPERTSRETSDSYSSSRPILQKKSLLQHQKDHQDLPHITEFRIK